MKKIQLVVSLDSAAEIIFEKVDTENMMSILENDMVRHVVKKSNTKKLGYELRKCIRLNLKFIYIYPKSESRSNDVKW